MLVPFLHGLQLGVGQPEAWRQQLHLVLHVETHGLGPSAAVPGTLVGEWIRSGTGRTQIQEVSLAGQDT